ncbi:putative monothiol glutaredoxin ydhD [Serratia fonticola]|nr:putative monothiol glutaredoxin ydhD [Serratia fonticola]
MSLQKMAFSWHRSCRYNTSVMHVVAMMWLEEAIMTTIEKIQQQISANPILLYMKGSPKLPSCGFSAQAVQALSACGERFAYVDILQNPDIRAELPKYANWPTFPQLWVDGELVGGCDIIIEMYQRGELQPLIKETAEKYKDQEDQQP